MIEMVPHARRAPYSTLAGLCYVQTTRTLICPANLYAAGYPVVELG